MKIVITGSEGFIGSRLKESLKSHNLVLYDVLLRKNIKDFKLDGNEDFVIHLAAKTNVRDSIKFPDTYYIHNYQYSKKVFDECNNFGVRCIYASSSCALFQDKSPYGKSKKLVEDIGHNHLGLRFSNVFGYPPRENMLLDKILKNKISYITNHKRDFIFIDDVISAIHLFLSNNFTNKIFNVSSGTSICVKDITDYCNLKLPISLGMNCEAFDNILDNSEILKLGWKPTKSIFEFLDEFILPNL